MRGRRHMGFSIRGPVVLVTVVLVLIITLTVLWNVVLAHDYNQMRELAAAGDAFHTTFIVLGSVLCVAIIVISSILGVQLITSIRRRRQQADFLAMVSHEMNSPLSSIKLFAQTLSKRDLAPADRSSFVGKILFDVGRLSRIIANILRAAEVDRKGEELRVAVQDVDLHDYLAEYLEDMRGALTEGELALSGEAGTWVAIDPMMFRQVLDNLVDNAMRYRGDRPARVEFRLAREGAWVELQARDEGIGIAPDEIGRIFDRFYRADQHTARRGMGIGLNVVRSIVESHGGVVGARSDGPGKGAVLWIRLPAVEAPVVHT